MKISKLFHWLYAAIMFLPLVVLPVFAIYSHRHTLTEQTNVDIQYKYESNEVNSIDDIVANNIYFLEELDMEYDYDEYFEFYIISCETLDYSSGDVTWNDFNVSEYLNSQYDYLFISNNQYALNLNYNFNLETYNEIIIEGEFHLTFSNVIFYCNSQYLNSFKSYLSLTQNNIPTYTDYNVIESVTVEDTNSDIMSVCVEQFNNSINNYFNMRRVFNLNDLYSWLNTNVFNNANSIGFNICFNLFAYWLFVSLFWLLFDAFMYIPLIMHNAIDKARLE